MTPQDFAADDNDNDCPTCRNRGFIICTDYDGSGYETACPDCQVAAFERDADTSGEVPF